VRAFDAAGLAAAAPSCEGKHPQLHFHFFTEAGLFGSLDKNEQQVDDGMYEIIDAHTFTIGDSTFRYAVTGGDTLTLEPVITRTAPGDPRIAAGFHHRILDGQRRVRRNDVEARAL
jgi:hypothetical protein